MNKLELPLMNKLEKKTHPEAGDLPFSVMTLVGSEEKKKRCVCVWEGGVSHSFFIQQVFVECLLCAQYHSRHWAAKISALVRISNQNMANASLELEI